MQEALRASQTVCHGTGIKHVRSVLHMFRPFFLLDLPIAFFFFFFLIIVESLGQLKSRDLIWLETLIFKTGILFQNRMRSQKYIKLII